MDADAVEVLEVIAEIKLVEGEGDAELSVVRGELGGADESDAELGTVWKELLARCFWSVEDGRVQLTLLGVLGVFGAFRYRYGDSWRF